MEPSHCERSDSYRKAVQRGDLLSSPSRALKNSPVACFSEGASRSDGLVAIRTDFTPLASSPFRGLGGKARIQPARRHNIALNP